MTNPVELGRTIPQSSGRYAPVNGREPPELDAAAPPQPDYYAGVPPLNDEPPDERADMPPRIHLRDRLLTVDDLGKLPPTAPLVDGLIYRDTLVQLSGGPGTYKTFIAIAMACCVATGTQLGDFAVPERGKVVYVAAEGANGFRKRLLAWCEVWAVEPAELGDWLRILPAPLQLGHGADVADAVDVVAEIGASLLVLDTRARCTVGLEENSATEQGLAIAEADRIRSAAGCAVLAVHHTSRNGTAGRGSNTWDGAVWSDLRVEGEKLRTTIHCEKHKDVESGCEHQFSLIEHTVSRYLLPDLDEDDQRKTLVLSPARDLAPVLVPARQKVVGLIWELAPEEQGFAGGPSLLPADAGRMTNIANCGVPCLPFPQILWPDVADHIAAVVRLIGVVFVSLLLDVHDQSCALGIRADTTLRARPHVRRCRRARHHV
ncbi:AAA family ATPase [Mycolicibacterium sphagni]|uniref:AAA family ATPase n=1 Tax=Mycolicibacterium sphagni TaxID=1786 RepID=UPI0010560EBB|nr:AAA family ATPase [Mycolicibacterium sphagni]